MFWLASLGFTWLGLGLFARSGSPHALSWLEPLFDGTVVVSCVLLCGALVAMSSRPRQTLMWCVTIALSFGTVLMLMELPAMLKLIHWRLVLDDLANDGSQYMWAYRSDPELGFRRRPNDRWSGMPQSDIQRGANLPPTLEEPIMFTYDQKGYRNLIERDRADVVLIGDSYVEGWYVSDQQTVASQLEVKLGRPVVNLGVAGYGTLQELIVLKEDGLPLSPRVVVWFFFEGNDFYDDQTFEDGVMDPSSQAEEASEPGGFASDEGWTRRSLVLNVLKRLRRLSAPLLNPLPPYYARLQGADSNVPFIYFADYAAVPWDDWIESRWAVARDSMEQAVRIARRAGIDLIFCFVPIKFRVYQPFVQFPEDSPTRDWRVWPIVERFLEFCRAAKVDCIDLTPLLQEAVRQGGMPYAPEDSHWSSEGHRRVALSLAKQLRYLNSAERPRADAAK